ncbi:MAG: ribosome recycling factor [Chitinophagales bacterium]
MNEDVNFELEAAEEMMQAAIAHLKKELTTVRAGKASPVMLRNVFVEYYGAKTPLQQVAGITNLDARTLSIRPWEKSMLAPIERAIFGANLGVTPQSDGEVIFISVPAMSEERRRTLTKETKVYSENGKVGLRRARQEAIKGIKQLVKDGLSEDMGKDGEESVQNLTNKYGSIIDKLVRAKEDEIMKI